MCKLLLRETTLKAQRLQASAESQAWVFSCVLHGRK